MEQKNLTKREFLKIAGLGSLGLIFWQCYDSKKQEKPESSTDSIPTNKPASITETQIEFTDNDVIFLNRNDEKYNQLRKGFNKRFDKFPKIIALCLTEIGVQAA